MIVVVADTSPLNYLVQIEQAHVLPSLYARVLVPTAVLEELCYRGGSFRSALAGVDAVLADRTGRGV